MKITISNFTRRTDRNTGRSTFYIVLADANVRGRKFANLRS